MINTDTFDENASVITPTENIVGLENFKAYYTNYLTGFSDAEFTIIYAFGQGDDLVKYFRFKGTHDGDFFGIPPSGRKIDLVGNTLIKMKNGRILQERDFIDNLELYQQLGIME